VWNFFQDVPAVARCLPGAEYLGPKEDGLHNGKMSMTVGPFKAAFEGEAKVAYDAAANSIEMEGKGVDKKGASRGKMRMVCALHDKGGTTEVTINADIQLSGSIAQFGRTGIINEIASVLISDFASNVESELSVAGYEAGTGNTEKFYSTDSQKLSMNGGRLLWVSFKNWARSLFGGS
jgi:carbon monoxide dehydrogenase subunit G